MYLIWDLFHFYPLKIQGNMLRDSPGKRVSKILIAAVPKIHFLGPSHSVLNILTMRH